jgi:hypothetical protein
MFRHKAMCSIRNRCTIFICYDWVRSSFFSTRTRCAPIRSINSHRPQPTETPRLQYPCRFPPVLRRTLTLLYSRRWYPLWSLLGAHREIRWPIRSHDQARNLQYDSNRTVNHSHPILNHAYHLWSMPASRLSQQLTSAIHAIYTARPRPLYLMNSLPQHKIYISHI